YCAWRLRGRLGALAGGLAFIVPGLVVILALSALFLAGSPPDWVRGAGMGAGAAVAAVAVCAGLGIAVPLWRRTPEAMRAGVGLCGRAGAAAGAVTGPWLVLVILGGGLIELALHDGGAVRPRNLRAQAWPLLVAATDPGGIGALAWTALKVGALSFGGG